MKLKLCLKIYVVETLLEKIFFYFKTDTGINNNAVFESVYSVDYFDIHVY